MSSLRNCHAERVDLSTVVPLSGTKEEASRRRRLFKKNCHAELVEASRRRRLFKKNCHAELVEASRRRRLLDLSNTSQILNTIKGYPHDNFTK